ncbi:M28 family metallopeptidase [Hymenobacter latericus]|uniref:M28 family metallopeptidase n=1 Tax=Hymenobacter sp. YIM 151858-1 TaxID=2987688 RepID=UPI002226DC80|nr:M28 family peptidase [Hymenobacter sp. YIM 151858-1]UYZ60932.1 M28 family peptidase [Hymenobacter sp. YIM 151858-1]
MKNYLPILAAALGLLTACGTRPPSASSKVSTSPTEPPAFGAIREDELRRDLFELASDSLRESRAGREDELRAAVWVADRAREAGLEPAGADGTYFQFYPLRRVAVSADSRVQLNGQPVALWQDAWVTNPVEARLDGPVVWLNSMADTTKRDLRGKIVAMNLLPPTPLPAPKMSLWGFRYILSALGQQGTALRSKGVAGIVLVADATAEPQLGFVGFRYEDGTYNLPATTATPTPPAAPLLLVRQALGAQLRSKATLKANLGVDSYIYPSINVIARAPGTDPTLRAEHVLFSGHHDHDGVGPAMQGDSIWNGADDNATVSVAMLAIGRAWKLNPGRRSALFVWHGAEERGLLGSRWYAEHPTVPKNSIVAVLNGDMIGRNAPDSAALLGSVPPHRNSTALVNMALQANNQFTKFKLDNRWDDPRHPEGWYFRSDHLPYVRAGIPGLFFTTLLHPDYHTPRDEAARIDIAKLARMTRWMYATGWAVSNTPERPTVDAGAKLER